MSEIRSADLFEDRGWQDAYYPGTKLFVWRNPAFPGLMIDVAFDSGDFVVFAGDPLRRGKFGRLTAFDDAATAIAFCERAALLADWPQAGEWAAPPAGVDEQLHQIALEVSRTHGPSSEGATVPTLDALLDALDEIDADDIDAKHAAYAHMAEFYPVDEIGQRLRARREQAHDAMVRARREADQAEAEAAHMNRWAAAERAKGRPEAELTWGNCVRETGILK